MVRLILSQRILGPHRSRRPVGRRSFLTAACAALAILGAAWVLAGCVPAVLPTPTAQSSATPQAGPPPTSLFPSRTPTSPATLTVTPSPTPSALPTPDFHDASVYGVAHLSRSRLLVSIVVPSARTDPQVLARSYSAQVETSRLDCQVLAQYPDRLYCTGPEPFVSFKAESTILSLYDGQSPGPIFVTNFTIPGIPTFTPTPSATATSSPTP
jgi:hypothetical protein